LTNFIINFFLQNGDNGAAPLDQQALEVEYQRITERFADSEALQPSGGTKEDYTWLLARCVLAVDHNAASILMGKVPQDRIQAVWKVWQQFLEKDHAAFFWTIAAYQ